MPAHARPPSGLVPRRHTRQRQTILDVLRSVNSHPTAADLFTMVREHMPSISLGTVYRNLDVLAVEGQVLRLEAAGRETRFDGNPEPHDHIRCLVCGRVDDIGDRATAVDVPDETRGYKVQGHRLEFYGCCHECQAV